MIQFETTLPQPSTKTEFPSFSIVYETENLSSVELENIYRSLASLKKQDISPENAREFIITYLQRDWLLQRYTEKRL